MLPTHLPYFPIIRYGNATQPFLSFSQGEGTDRGYSLYHLLSENIVTSLSCRQESYNSSYKLFLKSTMMIKTEKAKKTIYMYCMYSIT